MLPPLTLYIHLPWCVRKCPYCDFNSHVTPDTMPEAAYLEALRADFDLAVAALEQPRPVEAVFFGGGTPSLFGAAGLGELLEHVNERLPLAADAEITLEANPGTIERGRFTDYRAAGINRVSLGVQSFDDQALKRLGRIHDAHAAHVAIDELHAAGLRNFNIDLMFGLPGQTIEQAVADVDQALAADAAHVSHYELTLEPNTLFAARPPDGLPDDDTQAEIFDACADRLRSGGFERYEISAWQRADGQDDRRCRHNLNYWTFGDYLGIGAGAHGKLSSPAEIVREARQRHPERYMATAGRTEMVQETRRPGPAETTFEFMLNATRLTGGVPDGLFAERTGLDPDWLEAGLASAAASGWIERIGRSGWHPTPAGLNWLNDFQALFLPPAETK